MRTSRGFDVVPHLSLQLLPRRCQATAMLAFGMLVMLTAAASAQTATSGQLLISEFRMHGLGGVNDEFVEVYNNSGAAHTVTAASGTGYGIAGSDGATRCSIPNGTVIPNRGHYLCVNSGYLLGAYPGGTGDATYANGFPLNAGIAIFNNNTAGTSYSLANRLDAVGSTNELNTLYKEGAGYPALVAGLIEINYAFVRDSCGKGGAVNLPGPCTISTPKDTNSNAVDFFFVDANGTSAGAGQRLGAPGPENLSSPIQRNSTIPAVLLDATGSASAAPNRVRDLTQDFLNNSSRGTLSIRRRWVNNTGASVTRLRFRILDLSTFPAATGFADLRARTSSAVVVAGITDSATCTAAGLSPPCTVTVQGTTLEQAASPSLQFYGGGFNSSYGAGTVTLATPLANGASINLPFLVGIQVTGNFRLYVNVEARP